MYSKQEASQLRQRFWTSLGLYMRPIQSAFGEPVNWINYKTGVRGINFRMNATSAFASISLEVSGKDEELRLEKFRKLVALKDFFDEAMNEVWQWHETMIDEHGASKSGITFTIQGVNILDQQSWPGMISFFKSRMINLDKFWLGAKEFMEN